MKRSDIQEDMLCNYVPREDVCIPVTIVRLTAAGVLIRFHGGATTETLPDLLVRRKRPSARYDPLPNVIGLRDIVKIYEQGAATDVDRAEVARFLRKADGR